MTAGDPPQRSGEPATVHRAYIALGANLGDPARQLREALARIAALAGVRPVAQSSLYRTTPLGLPEQADYCNAVCAVDTALPPAALFAQLMAIERAAGRVRDGRRWGPRVLDLDLLHVEGCISPDADLRLPHPEIGRRNFVVLPLLEIAPDLEIPGLGAIAALARTLPAAGIAPWHD